MANPLAIGPLLTQGIKNEFALSYEPSYKGVEALLKDVMWFDATSDKISELYGQWDSPIYPVRWDPGNMIGSKNVLSRQYRITNRDFGRRVYLPRNFEDDQTGQAMNVARGLGRNWARLPELIFYQYIGATSSNDLLAAVPNSADGNALYLASTRYGSSSGNVVSQTSSWTTVQNVITDVMTVKRRYMEFQDTESQPYWDPSDIEAGVCCFHGTSVTQVVEEVKRMSIVPIGANTATSNAGVSNLLTAGALGVTWVNSQRITDTKGFFFLKGVPVEKRAIIRQVRKAPTEQIGNYETSDHTRDTGEPYIQFHSREGWGSMLAIATIRVS